jgi:hypothetical protein
MIKLKTFFELIAGVFFWLLRWFQRMRRKPAILTALPIAI